MRERLSPTDQEVLMHARLTVFENVDLDLNDRLTAFMEGLDRDPFSDLPGYRGSMTLLDRGSARLIDFQLDTVSYYEVVART